MRGEKGNMACKEVEGERTKKGALIAASGNLSENLSLGRFEAVPRRGRRR
jgi:hypothetical protein